VAYHVRGGSELSNLIRKLISSKLRWQDRQSEPLKVNNCSVKFQIIRVLCKKRSWCKVGCTSP
jgi:hypothetical protein